MIGGDSRLMSDMWLAQITVCLQTQAMLTPALLLRTSQGLIYRAGLSPPEPSEAGLVAGQVCLCWGGGHGK